MAPHEALLLEAEALLARAASLDEGSAMGFGGVEHPELYEQAKALFERAAALSPEAAARARVGVEACEEMLRPLIPIQHLAPPMDLEAPLAPKAEGSPLTPWETRRRIRAQQMRGVAYTGEVFQREGARLRVEAAAVVEAAAAAVASGRSTEAAYAEAEAKLKALRDGATRAWKGHPPEFYAEAIEGLRRALKLP
ncbi:hypothetical protein KJ940_06015 [Myxococcota bacterium]|nr:hypothetical protein [Myxococcota bacterium]